MTWNPDAVGQGVPPVDRAWRKSDTPLSSLGVRARVHDPFGSELEPTTDNSEGKPRRALVTSGVMIARSGEPLTVQMGRDGPARKLGVR